MFDACVYHVCSVAVTQSSILPVVFDRCPSSCHVLLIVCHSTTNPALCSGAPYLCVFSFSLLSQIFRGCTLYPEVPCSIEITVIIMKVFLKRKVLSLQTILRARACAHTRTHTLTHTHKHSEYAKLNIRSWKRAANARKTWNGWRRTEQKTCQVYNFGKRNVFRLDLNESRFEWPCFAIVSHCGC